MNQKTHLADFLKPETMSKLNLTPEKIDKAIKEIPSSAEKIKRLKKAESILSNAKIFKINYSGKGNIKSFVYKGDTYRIDISEKDIILVIDPKFNYTEINHFISKIKNKIK